MNLAVVAIHRQGGAVVVPGGTTVLAAGDRLVLLGRDSDLTRFRDRN